jgi:hypothetical protein
VHFGSREQFQHRWGTYRAPCRQTIRSNLTPANPRLASG